MKETLSNLYKLTSEETNTTEKQVETVVEEFWYGIRQQISKSQGNDILIHYLGNFEIPKGMLVKYMETLEKAFQKDLIAKGKYEKGMENLKRIKALTEQNESRI